MDIIIVDNILWNCYTCFWVKFIGFI